MRTLASDLQGPDVRF